VFISKGDDMFSKIRDDARYSVKAVRSVFSGYRGLEVRVDPDWEPVEDAPDEPYYVCATFENGRHIPLPVILGFDARDEQPPLQNAVVGWMARHCKPSGWLRGMYRALEDCARYEHRFSDNGGKTQQDWEDEARYLSEDTLARLRACVISEEYFPEYMAPLFELPQYAGCSSEERKGARNLYIADIPARESIILAQARYTAAWEVESRQDEELLTIRGIGINALARIRKACTK